MFFLLIMPNLEHARGAVTGKSPYKKAKQNLAGPSANEGILLATLLL